MKDKWKLELKDVSETRMSSSSVRRGKAAKHGGSMTLKHIPTDVSVEGRTPEGDFNKAQQRKLFEDLHARLFKELEEKVAQYLRIAGR